MDRPATRQSLDEDDAPKLTGADSLTAEQQLQHYRDLSRDSRRKVLETPYPNAELIRAGNTFAVLDHTTKKVTYFMVFHERRIKGQVALYQSPVWRLAGKGRELRGVSIHVFFKYLLPIRGRVCTDRLQTDLGKALWRDAIAEAQQAGMLVYYVDLNQNTAKPIRTDADYSALERIAWGDRDTHKARLVLISEKPLSFAYGESLDGFGIPAEVFD